MTTSVVCGAGGAIGGHLVNRLIDDGHDVICADIKPIEDWFQINEDSIEIIDNIDLSVHSEARYVTQQIDDVYMLACNMGGMGFLASHRVDCLHSVDITSAMIKEAFDSGVKRYFYSSSACVYNDNLQQTENVSLKEEDAWPALPEPAYGIEKIYGEEFCKWYAEEKGFYTRVARFHNVYGPYGSYKGGREKAPAAICRKVAEAKISGNLEIDIWGDGNQTRSFMDVRDCIEGIIRIMNSNVNYPINLGSSQLVSINDMVSMVETIAGVKLKRNYDLSAPQGVRGRNSDNTRILRELNWQPNITLYDGLERLYSWIYNDLAK